jgi:hypothetical protein
LGDVDRATACKRPFDSQGDRLRSALSPVAQGLDVKPPARRMTQKLLQALISAVGVVALGAQDATAQQYECRMVRRGDTIAGIARELTGNADILQSSWLQIVDTSRSTIVRKRDYDHILPGWQVCVETWLVRNPPQAEVAPVPLAPRRLPMPDYRWSLAAFVPAGLLAGFYLKRYRKARISTVAQMRLFASTFIREFEQPLVRPPVKDAPIRSRVECMPGSRRVKIFLAPNGGRSYPNLSDHRKNLEYDVARVLGLVADGPSVSGQPYAEGSWVVVTFQFEHGLGEKV